MIFSNLILSTILLLFFTTVLKSSESFFSSIIQTGNDFEIKLAKPLYVLNITSLDYFYDYYSNALNGTSVLNSCVFNSNFYSLNLTSLKNVEYRFQFSFYIYYYHLFSICSEIPNFKNQSVIAEFDEEGSIESIFSVTGNLDTETFELGRFGFDNFALKLTYKNPTSGLCNDVGSIRNYYFQCDENENFSMSIPSRPSIYDCVIDVYIKTKHVCPYKNAKLTPVKYSLIQPNILRFTLDENSSNLISVNNDKNDFQVLPIKPTIYSCENNGDIITVNGLFLINLLSNYTFNFESRHRIDPSNIISFNSTTLVINTKGYVDNNFFISLFENDSESYPILKPQQQQMELTSYFKISYLYINCTNCDGANLIGLSNSYTKNRGKDIQVYIYDVSLNDGGIYLEAPIYPFKRSGVLQFIPTDFEIFDNEIFQFDGSSIVSIRGFFIPKVYDNQPYIIGKLEFSNGTIYNLDYNTLDNILYTKGKFNIPSGHGNGNFSIYIKDKLFHSNSFSYQPPSQWISSFTQNQEKVQLHLSFSFSSFPITSIKYNDKNGKDLDYTLIEPNIISFTLNTYSTNVFSFNDDYHNETIPNGLIFRPIIYSYSIENDVITMEGLFLSKLSNYKFYLGDSKTAVSFDQVTYFDVSRLGLIMNQTSHVYVYSDDYLFIRVPDLTFTSEQDQLLFTCSNCLGGYININEPESNQDSQFSQIGTIVKQFNTKTIFNKYNIFTFTKDSKTIVLQPPLPTNVMVHEDSAQFKTFSNNTIIVSGDLLMDKYNGFDYTDFQFHFDNGTIYLAKKQLLSKSDQNYKYQINAPFGYGSGYFSAFVTFGNSNKSITNSIPFSYPTKPIITSISTIKDQKLIISGDGFFGVKIVGSFKTFTLVNETGVFYNIVECEYYYKDNQDINRIIYCRFNRMSYYIQYSPDDPITIQIRNTDELKTKFEPAYTQTFFNNSKPDSEMLNNDISLHSVFSKLLVTLFILISILLQ
ncbi:hypothetical protein ACTFIR_009912 [Dictyostelium discoideum]